jgi:hypothetical protein
MCMLEFIKYAAESIGCYGFSSYICMVLQDASPRSGSVKRRRDKAFSLLEYESNNS